MAELTPMMQQYFEIKTKIKITFCFTVWAIFTKCFLTTRFWYPESWNLP